MILGIGVDITQNIRFESWLRRDKTQLQHVLLSQELELANDLSNEQRIQFLASRFAAKEAFFKALSSALINLKIHEQTTQIFDFLFTCKHILVLPGVFYVPQITVDWSAFEEKLGVKIPQLKVGLSISHEKDYSVSFVIISM